MQSEDINELLEKHFRSIEKIILKRQDAITGLLPASTAVNAHGDYTDAWVRDNVYSILSVWGLALAYKKQKPSDFRSYYLSQSVVKLMRGLLVAMMRQSDRVEAYKKSHNPLDALHAKYGTDTGLAVVGDDEWGHLQLDATSLFILMLTQMIASGLEIIYTVDEVNFVQNLVHYISRTYSTPDYGIWERGNKINHGTTEINCSSVGMAKAALEAISGFNLFGEFSTQEGVVHVLPNDIARSRLTLMNLLPRESDSKESDAALLSIIGYPAYAVEDEVVVEKTRSKIIKKLAGVYGCKRFLLDGHQSSIEDANRLHYEPSELREFKDIESEWPLFFTYLLLDALIRDDKDDVKLWQERLEPLFIEEDGERLLPELYIVPKELVTAEKENPHSQKRVANENLPLVWAQSLYMLSEMMLEGLITSEDIDPLNRRSSLGKSIEVKPLVALIAENESAKEYLHSEGIYSESIEEIDAVSCMHAHELTTVYSLLGENEKLGLSGRELLVARTISTSRLYLVSGERVLFLPYYFNPKEFYFGFDNKLLVEHYRSSLQFLSQSWGREGRPIVSFLIREDMLRDHSKDVIIELLLELQSGKCGTVEITIAKVAELLDLVEVEKIDTFPLNRLKTLKEYGVGENTEEYFLAAMEHDWTQVRLIAQKSELYDIRLEDVLMDIVISQKRLAVGRAYNESAIFSEPKETSDILACIDEYCGDNRAERVLTQEIILHLGHLIKVQAELFNDMLTIRTWDCIQLMVSHISRERSMSMGDAYDELLRFAPHGIYDTLRHILESYNKELLALKELENLHVSGVKHLDTSSLESNDDESIKVDDWELWREKGGLIGTLKGSFYKDVWYILQQCNALVIGDKYSSQSRIGSELTLESTAGERSFELKVDRLLQSIQVASYRKLNIELIEALIKVFKANPELRIEDDLVLDVLIGYAVKLSWSKKNSDKVYDEHKGEAWSEFYKLSLLEVEESFIEAFLFLIDEKEATKS